MFMVGVSEGSARRSDLPRWDSDELGIRALLIFRARMPFSSRQSNPSLFTAVHLFLAVVSRASFF